MEKKRSKSDSIVKEAMRIHYKEIVETLQTGKYRVLVLVMSLTLSHSQFVSFVFHSRRRHFYFFCALIFFSVNSEFRLLVS